ncbi:MAG: V-type ATP synthase subunit D [Geminicoccaceae bacterium]|jgi:V/A-type H+-transporting ATPase subunit D|nr:V-type ATP synthase subunit D [Geminicoccaceae bacterium]MCB9967942.1 V-type ATP synthase subunit D [Geminicoccaceae bacterium]HRY24979.1 V-type ATP synthase subunit D [Geminicoccaceae bacterium]
MAQVQLSKSSLTREKENLALYQRYLPALDLKRQQLMGERQRARREIERLGLEVARVIEAAGEAIPMMADRRVSLDGLVRLGEVRLGTQNVAGVKLPTVEHVELIRSAYGRLVRPHWVDHVADRLAAAMRLRVEVEVAEKRLAGLERAVARITQRVNLFDKVLIPQTRTNIRRINVYLGDAERAAVAGAKIAKRKREAEAARPEAGA